MKLAFVFLFVSLSTPLALADKLILKNGNELEGVVTAQDAKLVTIRIEGGEIALDASLIKSVNKVGTAIQTVEEREQKSRDALLAANHSRKERLAQFVLSLEESQKRALGSAQPASYQKATDELSVKLQEQALDEMAERIQEKLNWLETFSREINRAGFWERQALREAVLSDLFPNYRPRLQAW